jgi:hypothetical protein
LLREGLARARSVYAEKHPTTLLMLKQLGEACTENGMSDETEDLSRAYLRPPRQTSGEESHAALVAQAHFVNALVAGKQLKEAESLGADLITRAAASSEPTAWERTLWRTVCGRTRFGLERYDEAESVLLETHEPAESGQRPEVIKALIQLYDAWQKQNEARRWRAALEARHADKDPDQTS